MPDSFRLSDGPRRSAWKRFLWRVAPSWGAAALLATGVVVAADRLQDSPPPQCETAAVSNPADVAQLSAALQEFTRSFRADPMSEASLASLDKMVKRVLATPDIDCPPALAEAQRALKVLWSDASAIVELGPPRSVEDRERAKAQISLIVNSLPLCN